MSSGKESAVVQLQRWHEAAPERLTPDITRQMVVGDRAMFCRFTYEPGTAEPVHHHDAEQFSFVVRGRVRFLLEDGPLEVGPGEVLYIPSNVAHGAEVLADGAEMIEVFSPLRPDFLPRGGAA